MSCHMQAQPRSCYPAWVCASERNGGCVHAPKRGRNASHPAAADGRAHTAAGCSVSTGALKAFARLGWASGAASDVSFRQVGEDAGAAAAPLGRGATAGKGERSCVFAAGSQRDDGASGAGA